jgi:hypothetical protein
MLASGCSAGKASQPPSGGRPACTGNSPNKKEGFSQPRVRVRGALLAVNFGVICDI